MMSNDSPNDSPPGDSPPGESPPGESPRTIAPTLKLSRLGLTACFAAMLVAGFGVYAIFPESVDGPPLPVKAVIDRQPVETAHGKGAVLTEVIIVENLADHEIRKLTVDINGQYLYLQNSPLMPHETLVLPQRMFTDKRSSTRFEPTKYPVEDITVAGQLPSGARGMTQFKIQLDHSQVKSP